MPTRRSRSRRTCGRQSSKLGSSATSLPSKRIFRPPEFIGANAGLWEDSSELRRHLAESALPEVLDHVLIAVSWFSIFDFADAGKLGHNYRFPSRPAVTSGGLA
jgi:hypothetical protein